MKDAFQVALLITSIPLPRMCTYLSQSSQKISMKKYNILGVIGTGAQAIAYLVENREQNNKRYVMKKVVPACRSMIEQEVQILLQLKHPNIISYHECFEHDMCLHIVTEYCQGGDLAHLLAAIKKKGQIVAPDVGKSWIIQLCYALQYCHDHNIIHRDVKTANVFLSEDQRTVLLGDFGIARVLEGGGMASTMVGSPYNFSPELVQGKPYDAKSDAWALGCVMYEILNLKRPFDVDNIGQLVQLISIAKYGAMESSVPLALKNTIGLLLQKDPRSRPSAGQVAALLRTKEGNAHSDGRRCASNSEASPPVPPPPPPDNACDDGKPPPPARRSPPHVTRDKENNKDKGEERPAKGGEKETNALPLPGPRRRNPANIPPHRVTPGPSSDDISATEWTAKMTREIDSILTFVRKYKAVDDEVRAARAVRVGDVLREPSLKQDRAKIPMRQNKLAQEMAAAEEKREKLVAERDAKVQRREEERVRLHEKRKDNARVRQEAAESRRLLSRTRMNVTLSERFPPGSPARMVMVTSVLCASTWG